MFGLPLDSLPTSAVVLFVIAMIAVCVFEFVNGFHDTANAVATVIYTKSLKPQVAVIWSGLLNFFGVLAGGVAVAMGIVKLLPLASMADQPMVESIALVLSLLIAAIVWNFGTWYFGIPCSSSHTLIGSILGAGLGFQVIHGGPGVNWEKAKDIGMSLLLSPAFGFTMAILLIFLLHKVMKQKDLFKQADPEQTPPWPVRILLIITCSLVSFFHGSNDGQKGVGLLMVVLITFFPIEFALNDHFGEAKTKEALNKIELVLAANASGNLLEKEFYKSIEIVKQLENDVDAYADGSKKQRFEIRKRVQNLVKSLEFISKDPEVLPKKEIRDELKSHVKYLKLFTDFAPPWAVGIIALSIGLGTMIGWKRIVVTIGEKIGKTHLTYGQGAVSELIASITIGLSTYFGLPVSTTHVLSSGIAGSMVATGGVKNLQKGTMVNIMLAWVLTLPVVIVMAFLLYLGIRVIL